MSITTTTVCAPPWSRGLMIMATGTPMITLTTITMNMLICTIMPTPIHMIMLTVTLTNMSTNMSMSMSMSRVICTTARGKQDCRYPAWDSAS